MEDAKRDEDFKSASPVARAQHGGSHRLVPFVLEHVVLKYIWLDQDQRVKQAHGSRRSLVGCSLQVSFLV